MGVASLALAAGASAGTGGISPSAETEVNDVRCVAGCAGVRKAAEDSRVELSGRKLGDTRQVAFNRDGGGLVEAPALNPSGRTVQARVPAGATSGKPRAVDSNGDRFKSPKKLEIVSANRIPEDGEFELKTLTANPKKTFVFGLKKATARFKYEGAKTDIVIEVVNLDRDSVVRRIVRSNVEPFTRHAVRWNGRRKNGGEAPTGRYRFKVGPKGTGLRSSTSEARFRRYGHIFPVRGPHTYGDGMGAGRGHQGQDVFAKCGTRLVAARGGKVQWKRYHSRAGYYLVIDGRGTGRDYMYAHMKRKGRPAEGATVKTGQKIGEVSDTGNASGCHLHFELWSAPGWYEGGSPTNATDDLKAWDKYS